MSANLELSSDSPARSKRLYIYHKKIDKRHCGRCEILYSLDYPKVDGKDHCDECEYELTTGRMNHDRGIDISQSSIGTIETFDNDEAVARRMKRGRTPIDEVEVMATREKNNQDTRMSRGELCRFCCKPIVGGFKVTAINRGKTVVVYTCDGCVEPYSRQVDAQSIELWSPLTNN